MTKGHVVAALLVAAGLMTEGRDRQARHWAALATSGVCAAASWLGSMPIANRIRVTPTPAGASS